MKKVKIISTLGPASSSKDVIRKLVIEGTDIFRLNFSHADYKQHYERLKIVRSLEKDLNTVIGVMQDLQGPKIRVSALPHGRGSVLLKEGEIFSLSTNYPELWKYLSKGDKVYLDDGKILLEVKKVARGNIVCEVERGGELLINKGVVLPGKVVPMSALSEKDIEDIKYGMKIEVDYIAVSFVRNKENIIEVKKLLKKHNSSIPIVAKIEDSQGVENIDEIIDISDGIMVARGDMGVCLPVDEIPLIQKRIVKKCNLANKPVIVATHMLDSMVNNPMPTRAEVTDVANAIFDGADCLMLSAETAIGKYPVEAVKQMKRIIETVENSNEYKKIISSLMNYPERPDLMNSFAIGIDKISESIGVKGIVCVTKSVQIVKLISKYRPYIPVFFVTDDFKLAKELLPYWGVKPIVDKVFARKRNLQEIIKRKITKTGVVVVVQESTLKPFEVNINVIEISS